MFYCASVHDNETAPTFVELQLQGELVRCPDFLVSALMETSSRKMLPVPGLPEGTVTGVKWHANSNELGFTVASSRTPSDVYSLDLRTGNIDRWTHSETGGVDTSGFRESEIIHWKTFDGLTISGLLYRPPTRFTGARPVIINIHGGPEGQSRPGYLGRITI